MNLDLEKIIGSSDSQNPDTGLTAKNKLNGNFGKIKQAFQNSQKDYKIGYIAEGYSMDISSNESYDTYTCTLHTKDGLVSTPNPIIILNPLDYSFLIDLQKKYVFALFADTLKKEFMAVDISENMDGLPPVNDSIYLGIINLNFLIFEISYDLHGSPFFYNWEQPITDTRTIGGDNLVLPAFNGNLCVGSSWGLFQDNNNTSNIHLLGLNMQSTLNDYNPLELYVKTLHQTNPAKLTLQYNGTTIDTYDGSSDKTINIVPPAPAMENGEDMLQLGAQLKEQKAMIENLKKRIRLLEQNKKQS